MTDKLLQQRYDELLDSNLELIERHKQAEELIEEMAEAFRVYAAFDNDSSVYTKISGVTYTTDIGKYARPALKSYQTYKGSDDV